MRDFVLETLFFFFSCISFNSLKTIVLYGFGCFQWGKDTNLKANHNWDAADVGNMRVVSNGAKILI